MADRCHDSSAKDRYILPSLLERSTYWTEYCMMLFFPDHSVVVRARMRTEMEGEKRRMMEAEAASQAAAHDRNSPREVVLDGAPMMSEVMYVCPEIGEEGEHPQNKEEVESQIQAFLYTRFVLGI